MSKGITDNKSTLGNVCQLILERMKGVIDSLSLLTWSPHPWHSFSCRVFYLSHKYHPCPHQGKRKLEQEITTGWKEETLKGLLKQIRLNYLPVQVHNPRFYHKDVQPKDHITDKEEREFPFLCFSMFWTWYSHPIAKIWCFQVSAQILICEFIFYFNFFISELAPANCFGYLCWGIG